MFTFQDDILAGTTLVRAQVNSPNYVTGTSGWAIKIDGSAEFNNVTIRGGLVEDSTGLFYNGTPGLGTLAYSIGATDGTADIYGNALIGGFVAYVYGATATALAHRGLGINCYTAAGPGGPYTFSGAGFTVSGAGLLTLFGTAALVGKVTATGGTAAAPTIITTDTWHTVGALPTGWTALGAGVRYKLLEDNSVRVQISATIGGTAASGTVSLVTLGTGYVPANPFRGCAPGLFTSNAAWSTGILNTRFAVTAGGVVELLGFPGGGAGGVTEIEGQWDVPLD